MGKSKEAKVLERAFIEQKDKWKKSTMLTHKARSLYLCKGVSALGKALRERERMVCH